MRTLCPHCHAEESQCPEVLPGCRARCAAHRLFCARANGSEVEALRAENEVLRLENEVLRMRPAEGEARLRLLDNQGFGRAR